MPIRIDDKAPLEVLDREGLPQAIPPSKARGMGVGSKAAFLALAALAAFLFLHQPLSLSSTEHGSARCPPQPSPLPPKVTWNLNAEEKARSVELYAEAVRIPTQSYDDNRDPGEDDRWAPFVDFQKWLRDSFPLAHEKATIEYVNTLGIIATFPGTDDSLKPTVLMSHYDVVPAPDSTLDQWTHPPFSGYNDGTSIWGRGAADDKTLLVAQWEAITKLLADGWTPRRTLILSHGFDEEEVFARRGQGTIAPVLEKRYPEGVLLVVDEGRGNSEFFGRQFAMPGTGEKGYLDVIIKVATPGGHSSVPPEHTGIGIMSEIIAAIEANPFEKKCASEYAPSFPKRWAKLLRHGTWSKLAHELAGISPLNRAILGTTIAVDVVRGGVKVNALPEVVEALINFRIDFSESVEATKEHVARVVRKVADKREFALDAFKGMWNVTGVDADADAIRGVQGAAAAARQITLGVVGLPLEPAPLTPTEGPVWDLFAGTIRAVAKDESGEPLVVSPSSSTGNSDCKMYYNLTRNVFHYMGGTETGMASGGVHTVDEHGSIESHYEVVRWVHAFVQNADAYDGPQ